MFDIQQGNHKGCPYRNLPNVPVSQRNPPIWVIIAYQHAIKKPHAQCTGLDYFDRDRGVFRFDASLESGACRFLCPSAVFCYPSASFLGRVEGSGLQGVASLVHVRVDAIPVVR